MRLLVSVYAIMLMALCGCEQQNTIAEMLQNTRQGLIGLWQLEKKEISIFDPYPTMIKDFAYTGTAADFYHFKEHDAIEVGETGKPVLEEKAQIYVKSIFMPALHRNWKIDSLTGKRLVLSWLGSYDDSTNKTLREILYFKR